MKIREVRLTGLAGATVEGGWAHDHKPDDDIHTLVEVVTDEGLTGVGSVYTSKALTEAGVRLLRPLLIGERADQRMRTVDFVLAVRGVRLRREVVRPRIHDPPDQVAQIVAVGDEILGQRLQ